MPQVVKRTKNSLFVFSDVNAIVNIYIRKNDTYIIEHVDNYTANTAYFFSLKKEGIYKIVLDINEVLQEFIFPYFPVLINNISKEFKNFACSNCNDYLKDCGCNDLTNVAKKSLKYNNLISKILYLETNILFGYTDEEVANYRNFLFNTLKTISCKSDKLLQKILDEECIKGISENTELYELLLILKFLGLYLLEYNSDMNYNAEDVGAILQTQDIAEPQSYMSLYKYNEWSNCLCNTCLRIEEAITIFEEGVDDTPSIPINLPPSCQNIITHIYSSTNYFELFLTQSMFSAVYNDDNTSFPVSIQITSLPQSPFVLEDINSVAVTVNQIIPYSDIGNYRVVATINVPDNTIYNFGYRFSDGSLNSPVCSVSFTAVKDVNNPPNVIEGFSLIALSPTVLIKKYHLFNLGQVVDPEGDLIDKAKVTSLINVTLELYDGSQYQPLAIDDEIDLTAYTDNGEFIRATLIDPISIKGFNIYVAFADVGSLTYSNFNIPNNVMNITLIKRYEASLIFTGGFASFAKTVKNWLPVARIEFDGDYKDLIITDIIEGGDSESSNVPYLIIPASEDSPYNTYRNASSIVKPDTTNPPEKTYDIYMFTNLLSTKDISYKVSFIDEEQNQIELLNIITTMLLDSVNNENPMQLLFTQFNETNIDDFDYLEDSQTFPPNFTGNLDNPSVEIEWKDVIDGRHYNIPGVGLIGFIFKTDVLRNPRILDATNADVTDTLFKKYFSATYGLEIYISKDVYTPSTLFFKFLF